MPSDDRSTRRRKIARTQWTAQFLAASELVRRNYTVSFTMGNHTPDADLMVGADGGNQFWVDVKGQSRKGVWLVRPKVARLNLFYILVLVGEDRKSDCFFIVTQKEANELVEAYKHAHPGQDHTKMQGFGWKAADTEEYRNAWHKLPR